jgi:glycerol-3-phosphate O-acyltransferase
MVVDLLSSPPLRLAPLVSQFISEYLEVGRRHGYEQPDLERRISELLRQADWLLDHPHSFEPLHRALRSPVDYLALGLDFFEPLVDWENSLCEGPWHEVKSARARGENTILLSNHQTEADPQLIHLALRAEFDELARDIRFMAGERVQKDPIAAPFCLGRDLVCIYSRRHLDYPPERRAEKLNHNAVAMRQLKELLAQGGVTLYLAPSGGRDRRTDSGEVEVAPFDPDAIEMMRLLAIGCGRPTVCRPLSLSTYDVLPPPAEVQKELGEVRRTRGGPIGIALGEPVCWDALPAGKEFRAERAQRIHAEALRGHEDLISRLKARLS